MLFPVPDQQPIRIIIGLILGLGIAGAVIVALGHTAAAIIGNDSKFTQKLIQAGDAAGMSFAATSSKRFKASWRSISFASTTHMPFNARFKPGLHAAPLSVIRQAFWPWLPHGVHEPPRAVVHCWH